MSKEDRVLIIKAGYSEFLDRKVDSREVSLGDILRTTPILHLFKRDYVTWLTDEKAFPLLKGNEYIDRILPLDFTTAMHLLDEEEFDTIVNLEKNIDICKFSNRLTAWRKYGFRFDRKTDRTEAYDRAFEVLAVCLDSKLKKSNKRTAQELLFEMVGAKWNGEEYVLGYKPKTREEYDIGLNTKVGQKWPTKAWPKENWDKLERILEGDGLKVSRQDRQNTEILTNLYSYMDWLNSCRIIATNDSLGLHIALALKKTVLGLFGPTTHKEIYFYDRGEAILPAPSPDCIPCFNHSCKRKSIRVRSCMENIPVEGVYKKIKAYI